MRKNKKDKKQDINYLDLIPETNQSIRWHRDLKQRIILEIENKGMFNTIAQKVFGKPRFSKVHLDEMGTFIWPEIDGAKTVQELALLVKEHFGDKAEPLYPRIVKYFQIMESYEFVHFINKKTEKYHGERERTQNSVRSRSFYDTSVRETDAVVILSLIHISEPTRRS